MTTPQQLVQIQRCNYMITMINDQINDPNNLPYNLYICPDLVTQLQYIKAGVASGAINPMLADQYIQYIICTWSESLYYFQSTYFLYQIKVWTAYQGGDPRIWDGILPPNMRDTNGQN